MSHPLVGHIFNRRNGLLFLLAAFVAFGVWYLGDAQAINAMLTDFFRVAASYNQQVAALIFILLAGVSAILSFFTSTPLVPIAIVLWGPWVTCVLLMGGWTLGGIVAYYVGKAARHLLQGFKIFHTIDSYRQKLEGSSEFVLLLLFALAVPAEIVSYTLGILRYSLVKSVIIQFIANAPFAILALYSSTALFSRQPVLFLGLLALGGVAMALFVYLFYKRLHQIQGRKTF